MPPRVRRAFGLWIGCAALCAAGAAGAQKPVLPTPAERLYTAVSERNVLVVRDLLNKGVSPNAPNKAKTPLLVVVAQADYPDYTLLKLLVDRGAAVNAVDPAGSTALVYLAAHHIDPLHEESELDFVRMITLLLDHGADLRAGHSAYSSILASAMQPRHSRIVRLLLDRGADSEDKQSGYTPLHYAAFAADGNRVKALLKAGANVHAHDNSGGTPLLYAARYAPRETVAALLDAGAEPRIKDIENENPLTAAMRAGYVDTALLLIERGADVNAKGYFAGTPLTLALSYNGYPRGVDNTAADSIETSLRQTDAVIGALLKKGADVNLRGETDISPLGAAVERDLRADSIPHVSWVKMLLERGADVNAGCHGPNTASPLLLTINRNRQKLDLETLLLDHGANIQDSILVFTVQSRDYDLAGLLIDRGAKIDPRDDAGKTPLLWAAYHGHLDLVKKLLDHHADIDARDTSGQSAIVLARKDNHPDVAAYLLARGAKPPPAAAPSLRDTRGRPLLRLPLKRLGPSVLGAPAASLTVDTRKRAVYLQRAGKRITELVTFEPLLTHPALWTPDELNQNRYQLGRGIYSASAYRFFGSATVKGRTYLGLFWYESGSSIPFQIAHFVLELRPVGSELEITVLRKGSPEGQWLISDSKIPTLRATASGDLLLNDGKRRLRYLPTGKWK